MDIAIIVTALGVILTVLNILDRLWNSRNRLREDGAREALTQADVSALRSGNATILVTLDKIDGKMDKHSERITRAEEKISQHTQDISFLKTKVDKVEDEIKRR